MNLPKTLLLVFITNISFVATSDAQKIGTTVQAWREAGRPAIRNFTPKEYGEFPQNYAIVQDNRGMIYAANLSGVLEFDGVSWRKITTTKGSWVLSLAKDGNGTVFVGAFGDFGYLSPDTVGRLQFTSLLDRVEPADRDFAEVWRTHCTKNAVYFWTRHIIFRWAMNRFTAWRSDSAYALSSVFHDTLYVERRGSGLLKLVGDSLTAIADSKKLSRLGMIGMLPYDSRRALVCSSNGLFIFDGTTFIPLKSDANAFIKDNILSSAVSLPGDRFAIGSYKGGVRIISHDGTTRTILNRQTGLQSDDVKNMYCDPQGTIWLALNTGISSVLVSDPLTFFTEAEGIKGDAVCFERHQHTLYAATSQGVFYLVPATSGPPVFKPVKGISNQGFWLLSTGESLLAATAAAGGVYRIEKDTSTPISSIGQAAFTLCRSRLDTNMVFVGLKNGLGVLQRHENEWKSTGLVKGLNKEIRTIVEDEDGKLWLGSVFQGVIRIRLLSNDAGGWDAAIEHFGSAHGLPDGAANLTLINGAMVVATPKGHRHFDESLRIFLPDSSISPDLADTSLSAPLVNEDRFGQVFIFTINRNDIPALWMGLPEKTGRYRLDKELFKPLVNFGLFHVTYTDPDSVVWIGCSSGISRYDPKVPKDYKRSFPVLIRRMSTNPRDSILFGGMTPIQGASFTLPFESNSLRFEYAALFFEEVSDIRYQYQLEGFDDQWSPWTVESKKDYTRLAEGHYAFTVRAKNIYDHMSEAAALSFTIIPPWYRRWWAYSLYALGGVGLLIMTVKTRIRQLERRNKELEEIVYERTSQIVEQKNKIEAQAEDLKELDRAKSRFFANISHEFRTPLTLILAPLEDLIGDTTLEKGRKTLEVMRQNATRLLILINQVLDIARLESRKLSLKATQGNFQEFLKGIVFSFSSLADQRAISLQFNAAAFPMTSAVFDHDKLEKIVSNLLSNAFKFTPDGGTITVTLSINPPPRNEGFARITVTNTGEGIPEEHIPHIFDRFYQVEDLTSRRYQGTGIGLALARELVELHHGTITVNSTPGKITKFTCDLPIDKKHFLQDEVADSSSDTYESTKVISAVIEPHARPQTEATDRPLTTSGETGRDMILVVEDHAEVRQYIRGHLESNYNVIEAVDGRDGIEKAIAELPDLVISDVMMPVMDGFQLCHALKTNEKTSHIPVMLLTARSAEESRIEGFETGADDYLVKPFHSREMNVRVNNLIRSRKEMRKRFCEEVMLQPHGVVVTSANAAFVKRAMAVTELHLADENFSVQALSEELTMTSRQLHRKLTALINQSPNEFIRSFRLTRARQMIEQQAGTISEVAYLVGFGDPSYFSKCFREQFGFAPSDVGH